ncbi:hypothetical protein POSPLADRAFT_1033801 [Postia placenta MAD-698-R-SB12]|uniref:Uncharacterized protein n=1 Tax=Postia placenta MAD-698-R-SB12 TaxID=670580 RepID=A0A1X6N0E1_9APHY|nr:hypothetical protein POSPLADRAFT_1033801 [Postia placenta MAD-698-R-SB12]OSX62078.1 hypothetical protein POSPLADRAFT_1033801 [Postia placenta MAD-698-R-SB12]
MSRLSCRPIVGRGLYIVPNGKMVYASSGITCSAQCQRGRTASITAMSEDAAPGLESWNRVSIFLLVERRIYLYDSSLLPASDMWCLWLLQAHISILTQAVYPNTVIIHRGKLNCGVLSNDDGIAASEERERNEGSILIVFGEWTFGGLISSYLQWTRGTSGESKVVNCYTLSSTTSP